MSNGYTMDEMKSLLIKAVDSSAYARTYALKKYTFGDENISKFKFKQAIRKTQNPDILEQTANILIDGGIYFEDGRFYFPDDYGELEE